MFAELKVSPDDLVASTDYWQDKSGQVLMLSESIKNSLVQFLGPYVSQQPCCSPRALVSRPALTARQATQRYQRT